MRMHIIPFLGLLVLAGCGGGGGSSGGGGESGDDWLQPRKPVQSPTLRVTQITVAGTLSESASVTVAGAADQDGTVDSSYRVALLLDGGGGAGHLPRDAANWSQAVTIRAQDRSGNAMTSDMSISIAP